MDTKAFIVETCFKYIFKDKGGIQIYQNIHWFK